MTDDVPSYIGDGHTMVCMRCFNKKHCFGELPDCDCDCREHAFSPDDIRMDLIALLTAEAHQDFDLLKDFIGSLDEDKTKTLLLLVTQFSMWIIRQTGKDPVQMVQEAALYWAGGSPPSDAGGEPDEGD